MTTAPDCFIPIDLHTTPAERLAILRKLIDDAHARGVLDTIADAIARHTTTQRERATVALDLVQRMGFVPDPDGREVFQDVLCTVLAGGDCEDLAAALVTLLEALGVPARLVWFDQPGALNHVTAVANIDGRDEWAEASIRGAVLGENPYAAATRLDNWKPFRRATPQATP